MANHRKELTIEPANLWYLVGLITSDGCLSKDGRHVDITPKDRNFLSQIRDLLGVMNTVGTKNRHRINEAFYLQLSNKNLYEFLLSIGLTPNKSLHLTSLDIPENFFVDFLRGLIDGDGCLRRWMHSTNLHEQWSLRIFSGSKVFVLWLQSKIEEYLGCRGKIHSALRPNRKNFIYTLKYGKIAAKEMLQNCYYKGAFGLDRKIKLAQECVASYKGWGTSKTVLN
jgi:hypothetical protein